MFVCMGAFMNRNLGWALASIISIGSFGNAIAADMAVKAPPPPLVEPGFNWTGFYVGLNVGGDWGRSRTDSPIANTPGCAPCYIPSVIADINAQQFQTINGSGFTGGA
jgi:outer membrane immunogenic protein